MIEANVKQDGVVIQTVLIPENANELKYGDALEYSFQNEEIEIWLQDKIEKNKPYQTQYVAKVASATSSVLGIKKEIMMTMKYGEGTFLFTAWKMINDIIAGYDPSPNGGEFEVKQNDGSIKKFKIPELVKSAVSGKLFVDDNDLTIQQVTEIGNIERKMGDAIEALRLKTETEQNGKIITRPIALAQRTYVDHIRKIALCVSDPDEIPTDSSFDKWLDKKATELRNISLKDAVDTIFFLTDIPQDYRRLIVLSIISSKFNLGGSARKKTMHTTKGSRRQRKQEKTSTKKLVIQGITLD